MVRSISDRLITDEGAFTLNANGNLVITQPDGDTLTVPGFITQSERDVIVNGVGGNVPFCLADGSEENIPLVAGQVPFCLADGSDDNITLV